MPLPLKQTNMGTDRPDQALMFEPPFVAADRFEAQLRELGHTVIAPASLQAGFKSDSAVRGALPGMVQDVAAARMAPPLAARTLLSLFASSKND